MTLQCGDFS